MLMPSSSMALRLLGIDAYVTLGYYVYDDCSNFESFWQKFVCQQTICMKMVWF